jgi:hypothetical protein
MTLSVYEYRFPGDFPDAEINVERLSSKIGLLGLQSASLDHVCTSGDVCTISFRAQLSDGDVALLDSLVSGHRSDEHDLCFVKKKRNAAIDNRTQERIAAGFSFAGKVFSLSLPSQSKYLAIDALRFDAALQYPIRLNSIDDTDVYNITDANVLHGFFLTGVGTYRAHLDSGTTLKNAVRAATTIEEVAAIVDSR